MGMEEGVSRGGAEALSEGDGTAGEFLGQPRRVAGGGKSAVEDIAYPRGHAVQGWTAEGYEERIAELQGKLDVAVAEGERRKKVCKDLGGRVDELMGEVRRLEGALARRGKIIYLAGPYTHADPGVRQARFEAALAMLAELTRKGEIVFSPIVHSHGLTGLHGIPQEWEFWERVDRVFLGMCSEVVVLGIPGWQESVGVRAEIVIALEMGLPVRVVVPGGECPQMAQMGAD